MSRKKTELISLEQFLFQAPPYAIYEAKDNGEVFLDFFGKTTSKKNTIYGHCPNCNRASTFTILRIAIGHSPDLADLRETSGFKKMSLVCVRDQKHEIRYELKKNGMEIQKIGQFPSLAEISNDEVARYRKNMAQPDADEFHKAIGLAAHGVGVGSFVYFRRVFERLIYRRFEEFKETEGWQDDKFYPVRMEEKIKLLKNHLPEYLSKNRQIYSILSVGIHELDEPTFLSWFEVMKQSIIIILEDDRKTKEELERRERFSQAISNYGNPVETKK